LPLASFVDGVDCDCGKITQNDPFDPTRPLDGLYLYRYLVLVREFLVSFLLIWRWVFRFEQAANKLLVAVNLIITDLRFMYVSAVNLVVHTYIYVLNRKQPSISSRFGMLPRRKRP
jgi:hypothetical protein